MNSPVVLIIEDQRSMADLIKENLLLETEYKVLVAHSYVQAKQVLDSDEKITVCITDLNLPDADEGATVPLLHAHNITTVVLTANFTEETRQKMFAERVADYVIKDGLSAIKYAVKTVINLVENEQHHIWMLSPLSKNSKRLMGLLHIHRYRVALFESEQELLNMLKNKLPDLLIINEPSLISEIHIVKLIQRIRSLYSQSQLPVLITEDQVDTNDMIKLMKYGVNDFYNIKLTIEELYVRVQQNISLTKSYRQIEKISQTDSLTGLYNRRFFFKRADIIRKMSENHFAVMIDIDYFKKVNDTYGHSKGDVAIKFVAQQIAAHFDGYLVARFGGEEFCVYGVCVPNNEVIDTCENLRKSIETHSKLETGMHFTVSLGVYLCTQDVTEKAISCADKALYDAKQSGRNQVSLYYN